MQALQRCDLLSSDTTAMDQLQDVLRQRRAAPEPVEHLETCAQELPRLFVAAEREALSRALARFALDVPTIEVAGERDHRVLRCATTYNRAAGPVRVERSLYRHTHDSGRAVCPLELRAGLLEGSGTPLAAKQATWVVAPLTPQEGAGSLAHTPQCSLGASAEAVRSDMAPARRDPTRGGRHGRVA